MAALSNPTKAISVFSNKLGEMPGDKRAAVYGMEESVRHYCAEEGVCPNYVFGTLKGRWNVSKLPQKVPFCKGNCGLEHGKVQHIKDKITWRTGVCCYKDIHGVDCAKCADNTCPCAPTREIADARAHKVGMCPLSESNYDNTRVAREAYIAKEKAKLATANKTGEIPPLSEEEELDAQRQLDDQLIECEEVEAEAFARTPAWAPNGDVPTERDVLEWEFDNFQAEEVAKEKAFLLACEILARWNEQVHLQMVNAQLEELRAEEQRLKEVCAQQEAAKKVAKPARNWAVLAGAGAVKAPTVVPAVKGEVAVLDEDDYEWKGMREEKLM
jgi:hypothetical protein